MSISYKFYSWFSSSDSKGKEWTYIYSENINSTNPEYIEISPKTETLVTSNEKIEYLVFNTSPFWMKDFAYVNKFKIFNQKKEVIYDHIAKYNVTNFNWYDKLNDLKYKWLSIAISVYGNIRELLLYWPWIKKKSPKNPENSLYDLGFFQSQESDWEPIWFVQNHLSSYYYHDVIMASSSKVLLTNSKLIQYDLDGRQIISTEWYSAVSVNNSSNWYKVFSKDWKMRLISFLEGKNDKVFDIYPLDLRIISVKWYSWIDYIFTSEWLFFLNWIIATPIVHTNNSNYLDFEKYNFLENLKWGYIKHDKFIYSITKTKKWFDLNVLGSSAVGSPINFSSIISKDWEEVSSMIEYRDGVLISYKDKNGNYWIDYFSFKNQEKNEKWYLITKEYFWGSQIDLKKAKSIRFFCDKLKNWEYLKIFASINNWEFEEIKTLTSMDRWKNGFFEILSFNKEFHKIVFKLELKWSFKLYDFIFLDDKIR